MIKRFGLLLLVLGLTSVQAIAGLIDVPAEAITGTAIKIPFGIKINVGYMGTKIADPGWRYIDSYNWLGAPYVEGTYTVYKNLDIFLNTGYSDYIPSQSTSASGTTVNIDFSTFILTAGARYRYPLLRWFVPYAEIGVGSYLASVTISEDQQSIRKQDVIAAPEIAGGFYIPIMVPTDTRRVGMNIQCSFGLIRGFFVQPLKLDFGYLGDINVDGQRLTIGLGVSF